MAQRKILKAFLDIPFRKNLFLDKNVVITGGGTGLGKKMAETFLKLGANVVIASRKKDVLEKTCYDLSSISDDISYKILDLRSRKSIENFVNSTSPTDFPDIVVNNSAGNFICPSEDLTYNGWNSIIDIVLRGTMDLTLSFGKKMIKKNSGGVFLNISTTYAQTGSGFVLPSAVSKAACDNMTKSLAGEWGKYGIRINSIAPGPIYTEGAFSRLDPSGTFVKDAENILPLGRLGQPQELANLACFVSSDYSNWMTGQVINLDGGEVVGNSGEFNFLNRLGSKDWENLRSKM